GGGGAPPRIWGAALLGFLSALIVGPCLAPPLAGALLYIGSSGDPLLGGLALFALGLGMGLPLILLGTVGGGILPRPGPWMDEVRVLFGVILIGVAWWLLARILPGPVMLAMWAALLAGYGVHLGALERRRRASGALRLAQAGGMLALIYAGILLVGAASGAKDPLRPLGPLTGGTAAAAESGAEHTVFRRVDGLEELEAALAAAARAGRPAVVDFYADWCVECVRMERTVFSRQRVADALSDVAALQVDVTEYGTADRALMREFGVIGPPTILFFGAGGEERRDHRLIGEVDAEGFIAHLDRALAR
ncbi:cytochrome c biogenesis protein transmembrane region, partial [Salinisphaera sp. PC39]|uniref:cytochrome c biogenesis protein CcdA n=1 Tax=Salinisphaera sp. PC39 TaxID=1304156 RepID=UPI003340C21D